MGFDISSWLSLISSLASRFFYSPSKVFLANVGSLVIPRALVKIVPALPACPLLIFAIRCLSASSSSFSRGSSGGGAGVGISALNIPI